MGLIIDDATCLVNLAHFGIPQFQEVFPDQYLQPWKTLPREIPDSFVRKFGEWCHARQGFKGKYSLIPYPACVGWLDRELPGWSRKELQASLDLVRTTMVPDWDIHPEMVSHTWAVDTKTGRPYAGRTSDFMENWGFSGKSADQLAGYMSYALRILKNVGMPCTGITTPGGFGTRVLPELAQATLACRDVFQAEIPHYFRHLFTDKESVALRVEYASGLDGAQPEVRGVDDRLHGRLVRRLGWSDAGLGGSVHHGRPEGRAIAEVIARGEPAVMVCHWPGLYFNGQEVGFTIFQQVVDRLHAAYDNLVWMKLSELARYWAARADPDRSAGTWPARSRRTFACPRFTVKVRWAGAAPPSAVHLEAGDTITRLARVVKPLASTPKRSSHGATIFSFALICPEGRHVW